MPFIAPIVAGALGLGAIGTAVVNVGISVALAVGARLLAPKPKAAELSASSTDMSYEADRTREMIFGYGMTAGSLVYHRVYGPKNRNLQMVIALADHPCAGLARVFVNGELKAWNPANGHVDGFNGKLLVWFFNGTQTASPSVIADNSEGRWTTSDCFINGTWVLVEAFYDEAAFPNGIPKLSFEVAGMPLYDPRKDTTAGGSGAHRWDSRGTWEWSDNPALVWYLARRGYAVNGERIFGARTPAALIPLADVMAEATYCDELVDLAAGGTEKRYRFNGVVQAAPGPIAAVEAVLAATAGVEVDSGGIVRLKVGVARSTVADLSEADIVADDVATVRYKRPANELLNAVFGAYRDPAQMYAEVALPPRTSSADELADGGRFDETFDLAYVTSPTQGQRVMEIHRRRGRQQLTFEAHFSARFCRLEAGDWVTMSSDRYGWESKVFEVLDAPCESDLTVRLRLKEVSASVYAWNEGTDELSISEPSDLPGASPPDADIEGLELDYLLLSSPADEERPGLHLTWDPPGDHTIDQLLVQYRPVGSVTAPLEISILDPEAGSHSWISGVQGGAQYEARVRAITTPPRPANWSAWIQAEGTSAASVVALAATVPDGTISPAKLSDQARHELSLATAVEAGLGSLPNLKAELEALLDRVAEAQLEELGQLARTKTELAAEAAFARASVTQEAIARISDGRALAAFMTGVTTEVAGQSASIAELLASIDGQGARWSVIASQDGKIIGMVQLNGDRGQTDFTVVADKFRVAQPDEDGGDPIPVFEIGEVEGVPSLVFKGNMFGDGAIVARHLNVATLSAISADFGDAEFSGVARSANGRMVLDFNDGSIVITAPPP